MPEEFNNCDYCGEYILGTSHDHLTQYEGCSPDYGVDTDDPSPVCALNREKAAATWAHDYDADGGEYGIVNNGKAIILVRETGETKWTKVEVHAESSPNYFGQEVETADA